MRNKYLSLIFAVLLSANFCFAQGVCGTFEGSFEQDKQKHPEFYQSLESVNADLEMQYKSALSKMTHLKSEDGKKIIPVVVHVIHDMGGENISDASIQGALDILNANINGQASNFLAKTPDVFAAVRGDLNVEFRLAKLDPDGNPTTGINRVRSSLTFEPDPANSVKRLSYWNSFQYFNIWTVKKFLPQDDGNTLLGYAQFPWNSSMSTDGVVLLSSQMVNGGTLTHEVGHWLGLCHTWACGGGNCGDDGVIDTPPAYGPNFGINLSHFPYHVGNIGIGSGCLADSMNWAGEMFVNYMDYSNDDDCTMFTIGQNAVMNETLDGLDGGVGYREYLWSDDNVAFTGSADGYKPDTCSREATFKVMAPSSTLMCIGQEVKLKTSKSMFGAGNITSITWDFGDGNTSTSASSGNDWGFNTYSDAGKYDIILTIEYNETVQASAYSLSDLDTVNATSWEIISTDKIVQGTEAELNLIGASNITEISIDSLGVYFGMEDSSYFRGTVPSVVYIAYYANNCIATDTIEKFIKIDSTVASNNNSSYSYSFESENDLLSGPWDFVSPSVVESDEWSFNSVESSTWEWIDGVAKQGSSAIKINGDNVSMGSHEIISVAYDLSALSDPAIKFSWSGAAVNYFPVNLLDIFYSTNCGQSWAVLGSLKSTASEERGVRIDGTIVNLNDPFVVDTTTLYGVANAGLYTTNFKPIDKEWRDTILTKIQNGNNLLKDNNIRFKFEYIVHGRGNNFYLDNIQIGEQLELFQSEISTVNKLSIFPNPTKGKTTIALENLAELDVNVSLVNILGVEVQQLFDGTIISNLQTIDAELSSLEKGIYFVKVTHKGDIILTDKMILHK